MSEADDVTARELQRAAQRALDDKRRPADDGGPPTMPTDVVRQPSMRPDPGLPDPLSGRVAPQSSVPQQRPVSPIPQPRPRPQVQQQPAPQARFRPDNAPVQQPSSRPQPQVQQPSYLPDPQAQRQQAPAQRPGRVPPVDPLAYGAGQSTGQTTGSDPAGQRIDQRHAVAQQWTDARSAQPRAQRPAKSKGKRKRDAKEVQGNRAREAKWAANRWAVPYFTDGPKVTFGVLWFLFLMGGALLGYNYDNSAVSSVAVAVVTSTVAALAGLQIGFSWFPKNSATRSWTAGAAFVAGLAGFYGPWGVLIGLVLGLLVLTAYLLLYRGHRRSSAELFDVLVRAAIPVGLASASLGAMAFRNLPVLIALVLFVSAYEMGDFLVGSGAFNPVEGPMAGLIAAGVVAFFLFLIQPDPFSSETILMFVAVAAICCVAGQYLASALLPRGSAWAPALRRLDSYLLVAPLWLLLLVLLPDIH